MGQKRVCFPVSRKLDSNAKFKTAKWKAIRRYSSFNIMILPLLPLKKTYSLIVTNYFRQKMDFAICKYKDVTYANCIILQQA